MLNMNLNTITNDSDWDKWSYDFLSQLPIGVGLIVYQTQAHVPKELVLPHLKDGSKVGGKGGGGDKPAITELLMRSFMRLRDQGLVTIEKNAVFVKGATFFSPWLSTTPRFIQPSNNTCSLIKRVK